MKGLWNWLGEPCVGSGHRSGRGSFEDEPTVRLYQRQTWRGLAEHLGGLTEEEVAIV
jgi:hypothetical protein